MNKGVFDIKPNIVQYQINNKKIESFKVAEKNKNFILKKISDIVRKNKISVIGISSPCGVDTKTGYLHGISSIKDYGEFNIYKELGELVDNNAFIIAHNNANATLLGNLVGEKFESASQITIGSAIGGALFINNKIFVGRNAMAGEFGYSPYNNGLNISESCSEPALLSIINRVIGNSFDTFKKVISSKVNITRALSIWTQNVASLLANIAFSIGTEIIYVSGNITKNEFIREQIYFKFEEIMRRHHYDFNFQIIFKNIDNPALVGMNQLVDKMIP